MLHNNGTLSCPKPAAVSGLLVLWYSGRAADSMHQQWLCIIVSL